MSMGNNRQQTMIKTTIINKERKLMRLFLINSMVLMLVMMINNEAHAQKHMESTSLKTMTQFDLFAFKNANEETRNRRFFDEWSNTEAHENLYTIMPLSKDGSIGSAYTEFAKLSIEEFDLNKDSVWNIDEYALHVSKILHIRKLINPSSYPEKAKDLKNSDQVIIEFDALDFNNDTFIDYKECASFIFIRDIMGPQKITDVDGVISIASLNVFSTIRTNKDVFDGAILNSINYIYGKREGFSEEMGQKIWDIVHNTKHSSSTNSTFTL